MIIDTSAILAILLREPDAERFSSVIAAASSRRISAATLLEATIVLESRFGPAAGHELDGFLEKGSNRTGAGHLRTGADGTPGLAEIRQGQPPGRTELRAYALSTAPREPLLFKGSDFELTDIAAA